MSVKSNLNNPRMTTALFAILVKRLGGEVEIKQEDFDDVSYDLLEEEGFEDGSIKFRLKTRNME